MVTFDQVCERVLAFLSPPMVLDLGGADAVKAVIRKTILECGMLVHSTTGEVYNPAPRRKSSYPEDANDFHYPELPRRRGRR